jgi:hypothetical protein
MDVVEIVMDLRRRGMRLWSENGHVIVEPDALTETDVTTILAHKPAILALLRTEVPARAADTAPGPTRAGQFAWTPEAAAMMLATVLERIGYWREAAPLEVRPRLEEVMRAYESTLAESLDSRDYNALRLAAIEMQRQIGDVISGYGLH